MPHPPRERPPPASPSAPTQSAVAEDAKRRERLKQEEAAEQQRRASEVQSAVRHAIDDVGIVVAPAAEISETEILAAFIVPSVERELPPGLPSDLAERARGKRVDVAVRFDFLSEVFVDNTPLSRPKFEEAAETLDLSGLVVRRLEVLGPRLGYGTMYSADLGGGRKHVFISRKPTLPMPDELLVALLRE